MIYRKVKRLMDFIASLLLLILLSPVMAVVSVMIKSNHDYPVLFRQKRPGKNGEIFEVYKFRTMSTETERDGKPLSDMERITKIGSFLRKTSLDELPQFINVLKGDMSFIYLRPLLVSYLPLYTPEQARRHEVTPGISGWAQVNGRNAISWEEKFEHDVWYVDNQSFALDIKIFFMTIRNVLKSSDINSGDNDTMPVFTGSKSDEVTAGER